MIYLLLYFSKGSVQMKKSKSIFLVVLTLVVVVAVVICFGAIIPSIANGSAPSQDSGSFLSKNYEDTSKNNNNTSSETPTTSPTVDSEEKKDLTFYVNTKLVKKALEMVGDTTVLKVQFKLFAINETASAKQILSSGFDGIYDIGDNGTYWSFECDELQKSFVVEPSESVDMDFTMTYIVKNDKFTGTEKNNLVMNYMSKEIISLVV